MKRFFIVAAACAMAAGCSQTEKLSVNAPSADSRDIRLSVGVGDMQTRAGYTGDNLDAFQLIIDNKDNADYSCNLRMQKTDGAWNAADGASLTWNPDAPGVTVYAVAPAMDGVNLAESLTIDVPDDQSTEDKLKSADFLLAKKNVDLAATEGQIALTLEHKLSRLVIAGEVYNVKVNGAILHGTCDLTAEVPSVTVASDAEVSSVTPLKNADGTYECVLLPQSTSGMTITYTKYGAEYEFKFAESQLQEGKSYPVSLKVMPDNTVMLDRTGWTVTGKYCEYESDGRGYFRYMLDGDPETFWESDWNGPNAIDLPEIVVIDTGKEQSFDKVGLMNRAGEDGHNYNVEFYVSTDDKTWWNFDHEQWRLNGGNDKSDPALAAWKTETNWETQTNWIQVGSATMKNLHSSDMERFDIDGSKQGRYFIIKVTSNGNRGMAEFAEIYLYRKNADAGE